MPLLRLLLLFAVLFCVVTPSAAQSEPPAFSIAGGAGMAFPFHSDFQFDAFEWHASVRTRVAKYVLIEGMFDEWRHTTTSIRRDVTFRTLSGAVLGHADEVQLENADRFGVVGLNVLATGAIGRVMISGGGGPSLMLFRNTHSADFRGCTTITTGACHDSTSTNSEAAFAVQAVADVDFALTSMISAFGRALVAGPLRDPGAGHFGMVGGIRASLR